MRGLAFTAAAVVAVAIGIAIFWPDSQEPDAVDPAEAAFTADSDAVALFPPDDADSDQIPAYPSPEVISEGPIVVVDEPEDEPKPVTVRQTLIFKRGDTLADLLGEAGISTVEAHAAVAALGRLADTRRLQVGLEVSVDIERAPMAPSRLIGFALRLDPGREVVVRREESDTFTAVEVEKELTRSVARAEGIIRSSFFDDGVLAGIPASVLIEAVRILSWDVDFQRDLHPGNAFEVLFERYRDSNGRTVREGGIVFARLDFKGETLALYRHEGADGMVDHYTAQGHSVRKALLKTPIDGAKLSSGYGPRRHPVLGYSRMHRGLDFAAPSGTPIYAAGNGRVEMAGANGAYGNYVRLRHNGTYATAYAHMKSLARGIARGQSVRQGQILGYVGTTGLSTGPHLHYELLRDAAQVDPRSFKQIPGTRLAGREFDRFRTSVADTNRLLASTPAEIRVARTER